MIFHDFYVQVDLWDSRDLFVKLQLSLPLLDICIGSQMLRDWQAAAFFCTVLLLVLRLVSVAVLWIALPAVGYALLPAVGFAPLGTTQGSEVLKHVFSNHVSENLRNASTQTEKHGTIQKLSTSLARGLNQQHTKKFAKQL